ncbi:LpxL/LpxP family acyltransferase [Ferrovibrio xuzhouensis]|uniref:Lauroyl acyltransferase n=1 Tax=Ferrovibrio xuzhouensis TaxID=1576914 RepID=A0ABV7VBI0_9PROT
MAERLTLTDYASAAGAYFALWLFGRLPVETASAFGGWLARKLGPRFRAHRYATDNLARAMPELAAAARAKILDGMWDNLGRVLAEYAHLADLEVGTPDQPGRVEIVGAEHVLAVRDSGRPALFFSGHYGNWELTCLAAEHFSLPMLHVYRAANNPLTEELLQNLRKPLGGSHVPKGIQAARAILAAMKRNEFVAMLMDQKLNTGIAVPFFGREAMTSPALAEFALRFDCPVLPAVVERLGGARFRVTVEPPIRFEKTGDRTTDVYNATLIVNRRLEAWIRARPDHWFWVHRRWPKD